MSKEPTPFKRPPKKYQPKGLSIIYEDRDILVVDKVSGLLTVSNDQVREQTAYFLLTNYVRKGNAKSRHRIFIVHRLDQATSGLIVFAKNEEAKQFLQKEEAGFHNKYYAVIHGALSEKEGVISSYLAENSAYKIYSVPDAKQGKRAETKYRVMKESPNYSLVEIELLTGRKHQARVHMSDKKCPIAGDKRYGNNNTRGIKRLCFHSASLSFIHPFSKKELTFETKVPPYFEAVLGSDRRSSGQQK